MTVLGADPRSWRAVDWVVERPPRTWPTPLWQQRPWTLATHVSRAWAQTFQRLSCPLLNIDAPHSLVPGGGGERTSRDGAGGDGRPVRRGSGCAGTFETSSIGADVVRTPSRRVRISLRASELSMVCPDKDTSS
jgi:hypothetical protein